MLVLKDDHLVFPQGLIRDWSREAMIRIFAWGIGIFKDDGIKTIAKMV